jgi:ArsR family metal-binding transcriptional regulator
MPYLNGILKGADYNKEADSIKFIQNHVEITMIKDQINVAKFANRTELLELLDWVQDLVNDTYESMSELTPLYTAQHRPSVMTIYSLLPKTNCRKCGEKSCMAFAARLYKLEVEISDCGPLAEEPYTANRDKLNNVFA